jgi:uncharacterized repeat protein (TIGR01451 family)
MMSPSGKPVVAGLGHGNPPTDGDWNQPRHWFFAVAGGVWTVGSVSPGAPQTLTITAQVVSSTAQTNSATISTADQFDPESSNNEASATSTPQHAGLALAKTVSNSAPNVGETVTFTVSLSNHGPHAASHVTVADPLPSGLTLVSATPSRGS